MLIPLTTALLALSVASTPSPSLAASETAAATDNEFADLDPEETAHLFWDATVDGDWETVEALCPYPDMLEWLRAHRPVEILSVGKPFRRGRYPGVFVPYVVRFEHDGKTHVKRHNLALRNDNGHGHYVFDGGI